MHMGLNIPNFTLRKLQKEYHNLSKKNVNNFYMFMLLLLQIKYHWLANNSLIVFSGPNDHVFVYFADHGGPGLICFPSDDLYVDDLTEALKSMLKKKSFKEVNVLYVVL